MILALVLAAGFSVLSWQLGLLNLSGAVAAAILGAVVLGLGGWVWIIPMLAFFVSSSLLSKARKLRRGDLEETRGSQRDAVQVLANGGIAGAIVLAQAFTRINLYPAYLGVLAAVNADTWSTEIGVMLGRNPRSIINGKPVPAGTSGGVTWYGLLGALLGAGLIAIIGRPVVQASLPVWVILLAGFAGSVFDSLLGATVQEKRRCHLCSKATEKLNHCGQPTDRVGGIPGFNNDVVNVLCGMMGGVIAFLY